MLAYGSSNKSPPSHFHRDKTSDASFVRYLYNYKYYKLAFFNVILWLQYKVHKYYNMKRYNKSINL